MLNKKIEKIERMLEKKIRNQIDMLGVYLKIDEETLELLDIKMSSNYCDIPRLKEIIKKNYLKILEKHFR